METIAALPRQLHASDSAKQVKVPAYRRLIGHAFSAHDVISLIEAIFMDKEEVRMVRDLRGDAAQTFIDVVHEVRLHARSSPGHIMITPLPFGSSLSNFHLPPVRP